MRLSSETLKANDRHFYVFIIVSAIYLHNTQRTIELLNDKALILQVRGPKLLLCDYDILVDHDEPL